jgi:septal ring factor EnvC (AmiA/AmiB activator)
MLLHRIHNALLHAPLFDTPLFNIMKFADSFGVRQQAQSIIAEYSVARTHRRTVAWWRFGARLVLCCAVCLLGSSIHSAMVGATERSKQTTAQQHTTGKKTSSVSPAHSTRSPRSTPSPRSPSLKRSQFSPSNPSNKVSGTKSTISSVQEPTKTNQKAVKKPTTARTTAVRATTFTASRSLHTEQQKLERLQQEIAHNREKLKSVKQQEGSLRHTLDTQRKKREYVENSIALLSQESRRTQDSILKTTATISSLEQRLNALQREYTRLCRRLSNTPRASVGKMLAAISLYDPQQELVDRAVLKTMNTLASNRVLELSSIMDSLGGRKHALAILLTRHQSLKNSEEQRAKRLNQQIELSEKALDSIRADKHLLQQQLEERNASAKKMQQMIAELIAQEARRREEAQRKAEQARSATTPSKNKQQSATKAVEEQQEFRRPLAGKLAGKFKPHSLPWPTTSRTIVHKFGQYTNPVTNTVINNLGINIATPHSSAVRVVANGVVSLVHWLPGYGSLVIVDHGNDVRTVYANLSAVLVREGKTLATGDVLGKSGRSVDGEYVHIEIWQGRDKLNPLTWLQ